MPTTPDIQTIKYYDKHAEEWATTHGGYEENSYWEKEMQRFYQLLPKGKILEIGSGAGNDASALIKMGYEYTGIDASSGLIEIAKKRNPKAIFIKMDVCNLDFPEGYFDGFWTAATLIHIPKSKINIALKQINRATKVGGIGFISMKKGKGEKRDPATGRWFAYYSESEFLEVLKRNGFEVIETCIRSEEKDTWLVFYVRVKKHLSN